MSRLPFVSVFLILVMLAVSAFALHLAQSSQASLEGYETRYAAGHEPGDQPALGAPPLSRLTRRVVLIVIDGLRADTSRRLDFLETLRKDGAWTTLRTGQPSYSKPGYAVLATGAWPEVTGIVLNSHRGPTQLDTLFARVKAAGLSTAAVADEWWGEILGPVLDYPYLYPDASSHDSATDDKTLALTLQSLSQDKADLTLVHFTWADTEAHEAGGASSPRYLAAATRIDRLVARIAKTLDPATDTMIVTADHGHLSRNNGGGSGHGGDEPEVTTVPLIMYGKGVRDGRLTPGDSVDVAPTVAALLGVPSPLESSGRIRWEALWAPQAARAAGEIARARQTARFAPAYLRGFGKVGRGPAVVIARSRERIETAAARYADGRYPEAERLAVAARRDLAVVMSAARERAVWRGRILRLPVALVIFFAGLLVLSTGGRRRTGPGFVAGLLFAGLDYAIYRYLFRYPLSLGALIDSQFPTFLRLFGVPAGLALAVIYLIFRFGRRKVRGGTPFLDTAYFVWGLYFILGAIALAGYVWGGASISRTLPDFRVGYIMLGALIQLALLAPFAVALPVFTGLSIPGPSRLGGDPYDA